MESKQKKACLLVTYLRTITIMIPEYCSKEEASAIVAELLRQKGDAGLKILARVKLSSVVFDICWFSSWLGIDFFEPLFYKLRKEERIRNV